MTPLAVRRPILEQILLKASHKHKLKSISNPIRQSITLHQNTPKPPCLTTFRTFRSTCPLSKKGGKDKRSKENLDSDSSTTSSTPADDPFDFSILEGYIAKTLEKVKNDLSKLGTGGRFNPEVLENLRVELNKDTRLRVKLGELAQVVPKGGRTVMIMVGEKDHIKPIISAIQGAPDLNLQPQPDSHNALQLNVPIPPPTKASRDQAVRAVTKLGDTAQIDVKKARSITQKRLRTIELAQTARPDDLMKARKEMEKVVQQASKDLTEVVDMAKKGMEQS